MDTFDFITEEQIAALADDPVRAFVQFVRIAEASLEDQLATCRKNDDAEGAEDARYGYQSVVLAAGRKYGIQPFSTMDLPALDDYRHENYRQFRSDVKHYMMQLRLALADRDREDSVSVPEKSANTIRARIHFLREAIDKDQNISEAVRNRLHKRLSELEEELTRRRIRLWAVARVVYEILAIPGVLNESREAITTFSIYIMRELGEAQIVENENRRIPFDETAVALLPPRKPELEPTFQRQDLEDEIPF